MTDWRKINYFLNQVEDELGREFASSYYIRIENFENDRVSIAVLNRLNGRVVATETLSLKQPPQDAANQLRITLPK